MRLTLERSGGFAGIRRPPLVVDTAQLGTTAARRLETLVSAAAFFERPEHLPGSGRGADRFEYFLDVVSDDGRRHALRVAEEALDDSLRALIDGIERSPQQR